MPVEIWSLQQSGRSDVLCRLRIAGMVLDVPGSASGKRLQGWSPRKHLS